MRLRGSTPTFARETLAVRIDEGPLVGVEPIEVKLGAAVVTLYVRVVKS